MPLQPHERIIVALDVATVTEARRMLDHLIDDVCTFKIGPHFYLDPEFSSFLTDILSTGMTGLFVDFKHFDIDETVLAAIRQAAFRGINFATVHAHRSLMSAAAEEAKGSALKVLAVTLLTSFGHTELSEFYNYPRLNYPGMIIEFMVERTLRAVECGVHGAICSPDEVFSLRAMVPDDFLLVVPGIRPSGSTIDDHKRFGSPKQALDDGADYLVIGRPIVRDSAPLDAFNRLIDEITG